MVRLVRPVKVCEYRCAPVILPRSASTLHWAGRATWIVYFEKIRVFKAGYTLLNTLAWNNKIGLGFYFVGF